MKCKQCKKEIDGNYIFCPNCGYKLAEDNTEYTDAQDVKNRTFNLVRDKEFLTTILLTIIGLIANIVNGGLPITSVAGCVLLCMMLYQQSRYNDISYKVFKANYIITVISVTWSYIQGGAYLLHGLFNSNLTSNIVKLMGYQSTGQESQYIICGFTGFIIILLNILFYMRVIEYEKSKYLCFKGTKQKLENVSIVRKWDKIVGIILIVMSVFILPDLLAVIYYVCVGVATIYDGRLIERHYMK